MNNLETVDLSDLIYRYESLIKKYIPLSIEIGEKMDKFGKMRQELQIISAEFVRRGFTPEKKDDLENLLMEELKKRPAQSGSIDNT